jgi:hypothetical protein
MSKTFLPVLAAAMAAQQPATPAPATTTSNFFISFESNISENSREIVLYTSIFYYTSSGADIQVSIMKKSQQAPMPSDKKTATAAAVFFITLLTMNYCCDILIVVVYNFQ